MCMDMGGGSTEVCCGHSGRARAVSCIGIGSSRLANDMPTLLSSGVADRDEMLACMHDVRQQLQRTDTSAVRAELVRPSRHMHLIGFGVCVEYPFDCA